MLLCCNIPFCGPDILLPCCCACALQIVQLQTTATAPPAVPPPPTLTQSECLMALYNSTTGTYWTKGYAKGWGKAGVALGKWYGVTVDKANNVVKLTLWRGGLKGTSVNTCCLPPGWCVFICEVSKFS